VFDTNRRGHFTPGGIVGYPLGRLHEEVAYLAYHLHWPPDTLMGLEHEDRRRWVEEVGEINRRINEAAEE
jgi:hypothetical protein